MDSWGMGKSIFPPVLLLKFRANAPRNFSALKIFTGELNRSMLGTSLVPSHLELKILALSGVWKSGIFLSILWIPGKFG